MPVGVARPRLFLAALVLGLVFAALNAAQAVQPAFALTNCSVSDSFDSEEQSFLNLINQYRVQNGRSPLTVASSLNRSSAWMAKDMATNDYFSHTDALGRTFATRISQCDALPYNGENIAAGTNWSSAQDAFTAWRNSAGHNANMLNGSFKQIGIARYYDASSPYGWYWVTDFSTSVESGGSASGGSAGSSGSSTASPTPTQTPPKTTTPATPAQAPTSRAAAISSPGDGSTLSYSTTFRWQSVSGSQGYGMYIGTSPGSNNLLNVSLGNATAVRVVGFPSSGGTVYIRLWTRLASGWVYNDYAYRLPK